MVPGATAVRLVVTGLVQGVGFRPWVARQATALGLAGHVKNTGVGVELELHGAPDALRTFMARLTGEAPGHVASVTMMTPGSAPTSTGCLIVASDLGARGALMGADTAVCATCLDELFDPGDRRFLHPFIHCPACGPRFTIQHDVPFDRARTSLAPFVECEACILEGQDPADRRCHDQTNACPRCGPRLWLRHRDGTELVHDVDDGGAAALAAAVAILDGGGVLALKGVGGFHLVALATACDAVARLRTFKGRPTKPLAVMAPTIESLGPWVEMTTHERRHLEAPARPIVLLRQTPYARGRLAHVAPSQAWLGVLLPYAPVHHLLFWQAAKRKPSSSSSSTPWVMTSANRRGEPLIIDNAEAIASLAGIVDGWLLHDRDIVARVDDSVLRVRDDGSPCLLRRARGLAPLPIMSSSSSGHTHAVLAMGVDEKATVCVGRVGAAGRVELVVSPYLGGLSSPASRGAYRAVVQRWRGLAGDDLGAVAGDGHPDLFTSGVAREAAAADGVELVEVMHHHAHVAAVVAEHVGGADDASPVIALALDGHGHGEDGSAWGGELLRVEGDRCVRVGHLWPLALVGGDRAAREPWRLAAAVLAELGRGDDVPTRFPDETWAAAVAALASRPGTPRTTSLGRLFDGVAALLGGPARSTFEGEAPLWLESRAVDAPWSSKTATTTLMWQDVAGRQVLDWRPLLAGLADTPQDDEVAVAVAARGFHVALARGLAEGAIAAARAGGIDTVVLAGGCLANRLLEEGLTAALREAGLRVWLPTQLPCGDAALSAGQAWVAWQRRRRILG